jgi:hypothetical protein
MIVVLSRTYYETLLNLRTSNSVAYFIIPRHSLHSRTTERKLFITLSGATCTFNFPERTMLYNTIRHASCTFVIPERTLYSIWRRASSTFKFPQQTLYNILLHRVAHPAHAKFWSQLTVPLWLGHLYNFVQVSYRNRAEHQIACGLDYFKCGASIGQ